MAFIVAFEGKKDKKVTPYYELVLSGLALF
jgi:hypothetical protein